MPVLRFGSLSKRWADLYLAAQAGRPAKALLQDGDAQLWLRLHLATPSMLDAAVWILNRLARRLTELPARLRMATTALFTGAPIPPSSVAFAIAVGMDRRSIQRRHACAGLPGAESILAMARLARVWHLMQRRRMSLQQVAVLAAHAPVGMKRRRILRTL
jgi:hypothetical protein